MKSAIRHFVISVLAVAILPISICAENEFLWVAETFGPIELENISSQSDLKEGSASITLILTGEVVDAVLTADNSSTAQLHNASDTLVTEYKVTFDGDGVNGTGGTSMDNYVPYNDFLSGSGLDIKYKEGDTEVEVTLHVRASNRPDDVSDSGVYTATQTLTVSWGGL